MTLQCQTSSPPVDIYAGFVGTWIGTADYPYYGVRIKQDVELECSETKKKDALKCQYSFGHKGEKHFHRAMHTITLDPLKGRTRPCGAVVCGTQAPKTAVKP
jgi:hypothetical protein